MTLLLAGLNAPASAQLIFSGTGTFEDGLSTVGGAPIAMGTTFIFSGTFNPAADIDPLSDFGVFAGSFSFDIAGMGVFTTSPLADIAAIFQSSPGGPLGAYIGSAFGTAGGGAEYATSSDPLFDADTPSPTVFGARITGRLSPGLSVPLNASAGILAFSDFTLGSASLTATSSAPEASSILMFAFGGLAVIGGLRCRNRRA